MYGFSIVIINWRQILLSTSSIYYAIAYRIVIADLINILTFALSIT